MQATRDTINVLQERFTATEQLMSATQTDFTFPDRVDVDVQTESNLMELDEPTKESLFNREKLDRNMLIDTVKKCKDRIQELENNLQAKDELIHGFKIVRPTHPDDDHSSAFSDLQEALEVKTFYC